MLEKRFIYLSLSACILMSGCASLVETGKKVWGSSMAHLEAVREEGYDKTVMLSMAQALRKTEEAIVAVGAQVYLKDPDGAYLAAMGFKGYVDTTQVGVFFTNVGAQQVKVKVASMSPDLAREAADIIFGNF